MSESLEIFEFSNHNEEKFLAGGYKSTSSQLEWMKGKTPNIVRYNMPNNKATRACLAQKPQYLLLYSYNDAEQPLQLFLIDRNRRWSKEKMMATGYENPHHDEYVVLYLTKEIPLAKLLVQPLRDFASKKLMFLPRFNPFVLSGNEILQALAPKMFTFVDLFAGAGGLSEGFVRAGFQPIAHVEMDHYACDTLRTRAAFHYLKENGRLDEYKQYLIEKKPNEDGSKLWNKVPKKVIDSVIHETIGSNTIQSIFERIDMLREDRPVDIIIGGPPCQAYSIVGRARIGEKVKEDPRNNLYKFYVQFLERYQPKMFVFENVPGIRTAKNGEAFRGLQEAIKKAGYEMVPMVQLASEHGVLQNRQRVIIVGWKEDNPYYYPQLPVELNNYTIRKDLFADLPTLKAGEGSLCGKVEYTKDLSEMTYLQQSGIRGVLDFTTQHIARPNNLNDREIYCMAVQAWNKNKHRLQYTEIPADHQRHKNKSTFLNRFQVVDPDGYSHTLVAHIAMDGHYYIYPVENPTPDNVRSITIREAARIQSFPDDFFFEGSRSAAFKQIGNAVPVILAERVGKEILRMLKGEPL